MGLGHRHVWLYVLGMVLVGSIAGICGQLFLVGRLPGDRVLSQGFTFEIANGVWENGWQWDHFLQEQKLEIDKLVHGSVPLLQNRIRLIPHPKGSYGFDLSLGCSVLEQGPVDDFCSIVRSYTKLHRDAEDEQDNILKRFVQKEAASEDKEEPVRRLREKLNEQKQLFEREKQEWLVVEREYMRAGAAMLAGEHRLSLASSCKGRLSVLHDDDFSDFSRSPIEERLAKDPNWAGHCEQLKSCKKELDRLDLEAGVCKSAEQLERIRQEQRRAQDAYYACQKQGFSLKEQIAGALYPKLLEDYQRHLRQRLRGLQERRDELYDRKLSLANELHQVQEQIELAESLVASDEGASEETGPSIPFSAEVVIPEITVRLNRPIADLEIRPTYSFIQYVVLGCCVLIGAGLGWIVVSVFAWRGQRSCVLAEDSSPESAALDAHSPSVCVEKEIPTSEGLVQEYDQLAKRIHGFSKERACPVVLVSSFSEEEGLTRGVINLAIACSRFFGKVLLVEMDPVKNALVEVFHCPVSPGFLQWVCSAGKEEELIFSTALSNLDFMPTGAWQEPSGELDLSLAAGSMWQGLEQGYELILLYAPEAFRKGTDSSGAEWTMALSRSADGLAVIGGGRLREAEAVRRVRQVLPDSAIPFLGQVGPLA